jgi:large subunit ribosomal protein L46
VLETTASSPKVAHRLCASVILSRPPQITQDLRPFQKAFYLYQRRLNERTTLPFTELFYYKEGTPDIIDYQRKIKERKTPARDIGSYDAIGEEGWHDEVLVGAPESEMDYQLEEILKDEVVEKREGVKDTSDPTKTAVNAKPMPRVTEADEKGDEKSLDRMLQRTLYLLVKNKDELWQFPTAPLDGKESLRAVSHV